MNKLCSLINAFAYQKRSHYALNHFTLQIKDPEIRMKFRAAQVNNFDKLFWSSIGFTALYFLFRIVEYIMIRNLVLITYTGIHLIMLIVWAFTRKYKRSFTTRLVFIFSFFELLLTQLSWRD